MFVDLKDNSFYLSINYIREKEENTLSIIIYALGTYKNIVLK